MDMNKGWKRIAKYRALICLSIFAEFNVEYMIGIHFFLHLHQDITIAYNTIVEISLLNHANME